MSKKTTHSQIDFHLWATTDLKPTTNAKCRTCYLETVAAPLIAEYVKLANSGVPVKDITKLHTYLCEHANYTTSISALRRHLKTCLGLK